MHAPLQVFRLTGPSGLMSDGKMSSDGRQAVMTANQCRQASGGETVDLCGQSSPFENREHPSNPGSLRRFRIETIAQGISDEIEREQ